jgi:hypothetical protein
MGALNTSGFFNTRPQLEELRVCCLIHGKVGQDLFLSITESFSTGLTNLSVPDLEANQFS